MIASYRLHAGRLPGQQPDGIGATPVTIFVGPNGSGKSRILTEINNYCLNGTSTGAILNDIEFNPMTEQEAVAAVDRVKHPHVTTHNPNNVTIGSRRGWGEYSRTHLLSALQDPSKSLAFYCQAFLVHHTTMLDGRSRLSMTNSQPGGDLQLAAETTFQVLLRDERRRARIRDTVFDAFGRYLVLDPTNLGQLRLRLSPTYAEDEELEIGLSPRAIAFHRGAESIDSASDGVKAFVGIMLELIAGDPSILIVDEPEAFLHPALAFKLGKEMSLAARSENKRVFASTHSAHFVMGCIQSQCPVTIVRLTFRDGVATARVLPAGELLELVRHPLLRSTGVLNGLFYENVVVVEADTDRAFYQEVNERMLEGEVGGIQSCLFVNAQNKQTIKTIVAPLRRLGIPAAGIVDVDIVKEGGVVWTSLLSAFGVPPLNQDALAVMRHNIKAALDATGRNMKRDGGLAILPKSEREAAENLFAQLAEYGLFAVPVGEVEHWLGRLGVTGKGPDWLIKIFQRMGEDLATPDYVRAGQGDVWTFLNDVRAWLLNPRRKGIPD